MIFRKLIIFTFILQIAFATSEESTQSCDIFPFICGEDGQGVHSINSESRLTIRQGTCMDKISVPHKHNKCFTLIEIESNFTEALKECRSLSPDHDSSLVVIEDIEEYRFLAQNILKTNNNAWIGMIGFKVGQEWVQKWVDNKQISDTNWAYIPPINADQYDENTQDEQHKCVKMSRTGEEAEWFYNSCQDKNFFVCQSLQRLTPIKVKLELQENSGRIATLENKLESLVQQYEQKLSTLQDDILSAKSQLVSDHITNQNFIEESKHQHKLIFELQTKIQHFQNNPVPIGFIYVQLPRRSAPSSLWPSVVWEDVTSNYAGLFFRAEGGQSSAFGLDQSQNSPRLTNIYKHDDPDGEIVDSTSISLGSVSSPVQSGFFVGSQVSKDKYAVKFLVSNSETRPVNTAVRIWVRTR